MSEEIEIVIDPIIERKYQSVRGATIKCLKHMKRYKRIAMPEDLMREILIYSLKGQSCKEDHLDIAQRDSLYHYLKDKPITNPYIKQFIKDTEKRYGKEKCL